MDQAVPLQVFALRPMLFCDLICGFFRTQSGEIFFKGFSRDLSLAFSVGKDGLISRKGIKVYQLERIEMIVRPREFGIHRIMLEDY